jgi:hypothetical protein
MRIQLMDSFTQVLNLASHEAILPLQFMYLLLHILDLLFCANAELLDDLENSPQSQDDDKRSDLFENAVQDDVDNETGEDDESVEAVEPGAEVSAEDTVRCG